MLLSKVEENRECVLVKISTSSEIKRFLENIGLIKNTKFHVLKNDSTNIIISVRGCKYGIDRATVELIEVI